VPFLIAFAVGIALAGAAYWSYEVVVLTRHLQTDICELDDQVRANTSVVNNLPSLPPRVGNC